MNLSAGYLQGLSSGLADDVPGLIPEGVNEDSAFYTIGEVAGIGGQYVGASAAGAPGLTALTGLDRGAFAIECGQYAAGGSGSDCADATLGIVVPGAVDKLVEPRIAADVARSLHLNHNVLQEVPHFHAAVPSTITQRTARISTLVDAAVTAGSSPASPVRKYGFVCC